jgi:hypothetical protein
MNLDDDEAAVGGIIDDLIEKIGVKNEAEQNQRPKQRKPVTQHGAAVIGPFSSGISASRPHYVQRSRRPGLWILVCGFSRVPCRLDLAERENLHRKSLVVINSRLTTRRAIDQETGSVACRRGPSEYM